MSIKAQIIEKLEGITDESTLKNIYSFIENNQSFQDDCHEMQAELDKIDRGEAEFNNIEVLKNTLNETIAKYGN